MVTAAVFFIMFFLPALLELKKPRDAGPRSIFETDGKEIVGFSLLLAVYFRENSRKAPLFLEDIEPRELDSQRRSFFSLPLPDIEF
jgi:hypothetical protein